MRLARGILRNDAEAEDAVQDAYVSAFTHLATFRGDSSLATWLSRIVMNESWGRLRTRRPMAELTDAVTPGQAAEVIQFPNTARTDPGRTMAQRELLRLVGRVTDELPDVYRTVFVTRVIEGMSAPRDRLVSMLVAVSLGCGPAYAETVRVTIDRLVFSPAVVKAKVGDTIEWVNNDILAHTATVKGDWDVVIPPKQSATLVIKKGGEVEYYCRFHPNMKARIDVTN